MSDRNLVKDSKKHSGENITLLFNYLEELLISHGSLETLRCNMDHTSSSMTLYTSFLKPEELIEMITYGQVRDGSTQVNIFGVDVQVIPFDKVLDFDKDFFNISKRVRQTFHHEGVFTNGDLVASFTVMKLDTHQKYMELEKCVLNAAIKHIEERYPKESVNGISSTYLQRIALNDFALQFEEIFSTKNRISSLNKIALGPDPIRGILSLFNLGILQSLFNFNDKFD